MRDEREKCRFLPMRFITCDAWDRDGDKFYSGCVFDTAFGGIPAGEYRSVFVSIESEWVTVTTADDLCYEADFTLTPKEVTP